MELKTFITLKAVLNRAFFRQICETEIYEMVMLTKGLLFNPIALRKAKIVYNFGLSECNRVKNSFFLSFF